MSHKKLKRDEQGGDVIAVDLDRARARRVDSTRRKLQTVTAQQLRDALTKVRAEEGKWVDDIGRKEFADLIAEEMQRRGLEVPSGDD